MGAIAEHTYIHAQFSSFANRERALWKAVVSKFNTLKVTVVSGYLI